MWAPGYEPENAVTFLEDNLVRALGPSPAGKRLLDAGCGTGRRLVETGALRAVGVDLSPEMLEQGRANHRLAAATLIEGDICDLPLAGAGFDLVWCRLALGHVADLELAYRELARVTQPRGEVIVTDFHPAAHAAGHRRRFRVGEDVFEVLHHCRSKDEHAEAARKAGLNLREWAEAPIGPEVRKFYDEKGRQDAYQEHAGLPVVLALAFVRDA
jgi:malonyl-CoA O-methyltransferase